MQRAAKPQAWELIVGRSYGSLAEALAKAGAKVTYKEFPDVEHITVVQESIKEVFDFFKKRD